MGEGIISHLSCLRDKAVCLTPHINNVTGPNLPGLWRSHGSPLIPFDWEMTFIVGRSEMTSPWQIVDRAKRSDNPAPHDSIPPCTLSPSISSPVPLLSVCFVCATSFSKRKSAAVLSRRWIRQMGCDRCDCCLQDACLPLSRSPRISPSTLSLSHFL